MPKRLSIRSDIRHFAKSFIRDMGVSKAEICVMLWSAAIGLFYVGPDVSIGAQLAVLSSAANFCLMYFVIRGSLRQRKRFRIFNKEWAQVKAEYADAREKKDLNRMRECLSVMRALYYGQFGEMP
jgi:hypothetical protein